LRGRVAALPTPAPAPEPALRRLARLLAFVLLLAGLALLALAATWPRWERAAIAQLEARARDVGADVVLRGGALRLDGRAFFDAIELRRGPLRLRCDDVALHADLAALVRRTARLTTLQAARCRAELDTEGVGAEPAPGAGARRELGAMVERALVGLSAVGDVADSVEIGRLEVVRSDLRGSLDDLHIETVGPGQQRLAATADLDGLEQPVAVDLRRDADGIVLQSPVELRRGGITVRLGDARAGTTGLVLDALQLQLAGVADVSIEHAAIEGTPRCPRVAAEAVRVARAPIAATADGSGAAADPGEASDAAAPGPGAAMLARLLDGAEALDARLDALPALPACARLDARDVEVAGLPVDLALTHARVAPGGLVHAAGRVGGMPFTLDADARGARWAEIEISDVDLATSLPRLAHLTPRGRASFHGRVVRAPGERLAFRGAASLVAAGFEHAGVSTAPIEGVDLAARAELDVRLGPERGLSVDGTLEQEALHFRFAGRAEEATGQVAVDVEAVDDLDCDALWRAVPAGLLPTVGHRAVTFTGRARPHLGLDYVLGTPDTFALRSRGFLDACRVSRIDAPFDPRVLLDDDFTFRVTEGVTRDDVLVGPGTPSWVPLDALPGYVPAAMYLTEEVAFFTNPGISLGLINRGMRLNLTTMRYAYGGSTVSQQLVKNLFLSRSKTLSRKLEEAVIVMAMEQWVPKRRILEMYMNCIEFGPDVYGVEAAAQFYFGRPAAKLTPLEAVFLANLKPSPLSGGRHRARGASPAGGWWVERTAEILQRLVTYGPFIAPDEPAHYAPYTVALTASPAWDPGVVPRIERPAGAPTPLLRDIVPAAADGTPPRRAAAP
jgi:hypothetical protein